MSLVGVEEQREERNYCGRLCYRSIGSRRWKVDFTIVLKVFIAAVDAKYAGADARMGPSQEVVFEGEKITLDIPLGGIVLENGWAITPCTYPGITKHEVDKFVPGGRVPSCQLDARWTGQQEQPVQLEHKMELLGAKEPNDVIMIHIPPPQGSGATLLDISTSELPQHKLNLHDLPLLMEQFQPVANIWRLHGVTLGLTLVELDEIEGMPLLISGGPAAFLQEMLYRWLKRAPPSHPFPTLTMLCDALRSGGTVEERRVAYNLEQHYLVQKTGISVSRFSDMFPSELPQQQRGKQGVLTLKDLSIELEPVMDWYTLGIKLGVKYHKLKEIEEQYHQPQRCKHEVLSRWLRKGHNCTWRRVVEVLMQMGEMVVADTIKLKYLTLTTAAKIERVSMSGTTRPAPSQPPPAKKPKGQVSPMLPSRQGQSGHYRGVLNTMYQGGVITKPERVDIEHRREGGGVTGYTGIVKFKIGTNGQKMEFRGHGGSKKAAHEDAAQRAVNVMRISAQRSPDMLPGELLQHQLAGSDKVEVKDQQIQTETVETEDQHVQVGSMALQQADSGKVEMNDQQIETETVETKEQYVQAGSTALQQGYLHGVEVIDHTSFTYMGQAKSFAWVNHGFKLHLSEKALPPEVEECDIHVKVSLSGQFQFPDGSDLISGIYWIFTPHVFIQPVTVEIQHCIQFSSPEDSDNLTFVVAKCSQKNLPYQFSVLKGGVFSPHSSYGSIQLTHFSGVGAIRRDKHHTRTRKSYCAKLYYIPKNIAGWDVHFVITLNMELHISAVRSEYATMGARVGPHQRVMFEGKEITLGIPPEGIILKTGWTITPLVHPSIMKYEVDWFVPGKRVPSCQLYIKWNGQQEQSDELLYSIKLVGAKKPFNFFLIHSPASTPLLGNGLAQHKLNSDDLPFLMEQLQPVASYWKFLGLLLQLKMGELNEIEGMPLLIPGGPAAFLREMIYRWLKRAPPSHPFPTLTKLCDALRSCTMEESRVAYNLEQHYLVQRTGGETGRVRNTLEEN